MTLGALVDAGVSLSKLNDELAKIIKDLRQKKGLPEEDPYVSPVEEAIEPIVRMQEQEQEQRAANRMASQGFEKVTPTPEPEAAAPSEQEQEQGQEAP